MKVVNVLAVFLVLVMMVGVTGCVTEKDTVENGKNSSSSAVVESGSDLDEVEKKELAEITYATFMVGSHVSAKAEEQVIKEFNELYGDEIKVIIEELPSDDAYVNKMKALAASMELPDIVIGKQGIRELAIKNGQAVDLLPLLEEDEDWKNYVGEGAMAYNTSDEGGLYSIANAKQLIGYFYNKEMFNEAGIEPAGTWDEFMENNEKLSALGYTPLALMTGENAWTTNLWLAAIIGSDGDEGNAFMNTSRPLDYTNDSVLKGLGIIQTMLNKYTTSDAIGAQYANAANNFLQENAAMIANGPWMVPDFSDETKASQGLSDRVGVALYPENGIVAQYEVGYVLCTSEKDKEIQDAALKFLKFKTGKRAQDIFLEMSGALPLTAKVELSDEYIAENPLVAELIEISGNAKYTFENIDNTAYSSVVSEFALRYPDLAFLNSTPEEMASYLSEAAKKSQ